MKKEQYNTQICLERAWKRDRGGLQREERDRVSERRERALTNSVKSQRERVTDKRACFPKIYIYIYWFVID